jgi:hypothetical protein
MGGYTWSLISRQQLLANTDKTFSNHAIFLQENKMFSLQLQLHLLTLKYEGIEIKFAYEGGSIRS